MTDLGLEGTVAVVTGAANGIGRAVVVELAGAGALVLACDVDEPGLAATASTVEGLGGRVVAVRADVSRAAEVSSVVERAARELGPIGALVNNAGVEGPVVPLGDYPPDAFERVMAVNVGGVFLGLRAVLPGMIERGAGAVVNLSSVAGLEGVPGIGPYSASKHAVVGLTKSAAKEAGPHGVRVNAVAPGPIATRMIDALATGLAPEDPSGAAGREILTSMTPIGRYGGPEEVARVIAFLCSPASSYVNGAVWTVDGGQVA
jgi:NAD(P)-dependent dehydrogenase (short-subunit alcohol dehydrogenase family)